MSVISFKRESEEMTKISNAFIKNEMPNMSGDFVKIYLYMLMLSSSGEDVDIENIANKFNIFTSEILKILEYLDSKNLVHFAKKGDGFELSFDVTERPSTPLTVKKEMPTVQVEYPEEKIDESLVTAYSTNVAVPAKETYSQEQLEVIFESNDDVTEIKDHIEEKYGVLFNTSTLQQLVNILEGGYVPSDVIIDIVDYLHLNESKIIKLPSVLKAIENKAIDINEKGLTDSEDIRDFLNNSDSIYKKVLKSFGLMRDITPAEKVFVDRWTITYHMPIEVINHAIEKTILQTAQPSFKYADTILLNWNNQNLHTLPEVQGVKNVIKSPKVTASAASTSKFNNYEASGKINDAELENMTKLFDRYN